MPNFSDFLKDYRQQNNLSQQELAARLGTTKQVISNYETGKRSPKISVVAEYAKKLDIPLSSLLGEDYSVRTVNLFEGIMGPDFSASLSSSANFDLSDEDAEFIRLFRAASPEKRAAILELLK